MLTLPLTKKEISRRLSSLALLYSASNRQLQLVTLDLILRPIPQLFGQLCVCGTLGFPSDFADGFIESPAFENLLVDRRCPYRVLHSLRWRNHRSNVGYIHNLEDLCVNNEQNSRRVTSSIRVPMTHQSFPETKSTDKVGFDDARVHTCCGDSRMPFCELL